MQPEPVPSPDLPPPPPPAATPLSPVPSAFTPVATPDRAALRELAVRHRYAVIAGIANALGGILIFSDAAGDWSGVLALTCGIFVIVAVYRLGRQLFGVGVGILCGAAMLVPLVWIGVLIFLGSRATRQLRAAGVRVGFLGADPNSI